MMLYKLNKVYFLSRPRRFGKTLAVSTFESLFAGRGELFNVLGIDEDLGNPAFSPRPVIRLDMIGVDTRHGAEGLDWNWLLIILKR
jgi:hypothetical protein